MNSDSITLVAINYKWIPNGDIAVNAINKLRLEVNLL